MAVVGSGHPGEQRGPGDSAAGGAKQVGEFLEEQFASDRGLNYAALLLREHARQRGYLAHFRFAAGHRLAAIADVGGRLGGGEAHRAGADSAPHDLAHLGDLAFVGRPFHGFLAHHVQPRRRMPDERADVDRRAAFFDRVEVLLEGLERPFVAQPRLQRVEAHPFDFLERAHDESAMLGARRRDAEAAIAHHHRGHAVPWRYGHHAVPQDLRIVVRVDIDEAGGDHAAARLDRRGRLAGSLAHGGDFAVLDRDVAVARWGPGAVDYRTARDLEVVVHRISPWRTRLARPVRRVFASGMWIGKSGRGLNPRPVISQPEAPDPAARPIRRAHFVVNAAPV